MAPDRFDEHEVEVRQDGRHQTAQPGPPDHAATSDRRRGFGIYFIGIGIVIAAALGWFVLHADRATALREARDTRVQEVARGPLVQTTVIGTGAAMRQVRLLGDARPYQVATLYAKVSGYLDRITVDKGDRVKAGDLIAHIESPELDQQYAGALADLQNKRTILKRAQALLHSRDVPQATVDNAQRDVTVAEATAKQFASLMGYQTVRAPFDGIITARYADPGALVQSAETNQQNALGLVRIADDSRLRVYVHVPQAEAQFVHDGQKAVVADAGNPGLEVAATITRTAGALDEETRTLLTEIDIPRDGHSYAPLPGSSVYVALDIPVQALPQVPATALILRDGKDAVATVGPDNKVHLVPVQVVQTDGRNARISGAVQPGQRIALNLPSGVLEGDVIRPASPEGAVAKE
jgi:RND family efflux transporter MFP subunit